MKSIKKLLMAILLWFSAVNIAAQSDFDVKISESEINEALDAIIAANSFNFGAYLSEIGLEYWIANINSGSIDILPNNEVKLYVTDMRLMCEIDVYLFDFTVVSHMSGEIDGEFEIQGNSSDGYELVIVFNDIKNIASWGDLGGLPAAYTALFYEKKLLYEIPQLSISLTDITPDLFSEMFFSDLPVLSSSNNDAQLQYSLKGDRFVKVRNKVEQRYDIGNIYHYETSSFQPYNSGFEFAWDYNSSHTFKSDEAGVEHSSSHYKYRRWQDDFEKDITRTEMIIGDNIFTAEMEKSYNVAFNMLYEGYSGNFGTINISGTDYTFPASEYIFAAPLGENATTSQNVSSGGKTYNFWKWEDGYSNLSRNISPSSSSSYNIVYKGTNLTNTSTTYTANNQRRIVKAYDGSLHKVYESMGKVWYETSTDDGSTWTIMNNGQPLYSGNAKSPAITVDAASGFNEVIIVFQKENAGGNSELVVN